jgi:hypothetical protein
VFDLRLVQSGTRLLNSHLSVVYGYLAEELPTRHLHAALDRATHHLPRHLRGDFNDAFRFGATSQGNASSSCLGINARNPHAAHPIGGRSLRAVSATTAGDAASSLPSGGVTNRPDTSHPSMREAITDADMKFFDITQPYTPWEHTPSRERANNSSPPQRKKKIRGCYGTKPLLDRFVTKIPIDGTLSLPLSDKARLLALPHQIGTLHYLSRPLAAA